MTERSLVNESKIRTGVVEGEPGAQMRAVGRVGITHQELPAHAQMGKQRILTDGQPQVLAAPPDLTHLPAGQRGGEVLRAS